MPDQTKQVNPPVIVEHFYFTQILVFVAAKGIVGTDTISYSGKLLQ